MKNIVSFLDNTFNLHCIVNKNKKNKPFVFTPLVSKSNWYSYIINFFLFLAVPFVIPVIPFFSFSRKLKVSDSGSDKVFFISSNKSEKILASECQNESFSIISIKNKRERSNTLNCSDYFLFIKSAYSFIFKYRNSSWFYPAIFGLYDMISLISILNKLKPKEIYLTNHYDRWASLIIEYCNNNNIKSVVYQHGIEDLTSYFPQKKIGGVDLLYCYDLGQKEIFENYICNEIRNYSFFSPKVPIKITNDKKSALIVGHGDVSVVENEIKCANKLKKEGFSKVFIKPHPTIDISVYNTILNKDSIEIIDSVDFFPLVEKLIHSGSTLALEYENSVKGLKVQELDEYIK